MKPYYDNGRVQIYHADCREAVPKIKYDAIVFDAPYGIGIDYGTFKDSALEVEELARFIGPYLLDAKRAAIFTGVPQMWAWPRPKWALCWDYSPATNEFCPWGYAQWQPILCYGKDPFLARCAGPRPTVIKSSTPPDRRGNDHPCPKPEGLMRKVVERVTDAEDVVADFFMGSGTTLVACALEGRRAIGIELEERFCEIAARRLSQGVLSF